MGTKKLTVIATSSASLEDIQNSVISIVNQKRDKDQENNYIGDVFAVQHKTQFYVVDDDFISTVKSDGNVLKTDYITSTKLDEELAKIPSSDTVTLDENKINELIDNKITTLDLDNKFSSKANVSDVYTKSEVDTKVAEIATGGSVNLDGYVREEALANLATKDEVNAKLDSSTYTADKATFATKAEIESKANKDEITLLATKEEVNNSLATKADSSVISTLATKDEVTPISTKLAEIESLIPNFVTSGDLAGFANMDDVRLEVEAKANITDVYTKADVYTKEETTNMLGEGVGAGLAVMLPQIQEPFNAALDTKADKSTTYTKDEVDERLDTLSPIPTYEKFFVVGVWGQSNAVGYDESPITILDFPKYQNRLFQINCRDTNLEFEPLTLVAKNVQDMTGSVGWANDPINVAGRAEFGMENGRYTKGIHLPLANLIADAIPDDYGVIIVPGAYGGQRLQAFLKSTTSSTGAAEGYYARFINAINKAMAQGSQSDKNILGGVIWCQGEADAHHNWAANAYKTSFQTLVNDVKTDLNAYVNQTPNRSLDKLWYVYEFPVHFRNINTGRGILTAEREVVGDSNYIEVPEDHLINTTTYTSRTAAAHYGENYFRTFIAPQLFKAMKANGVFSVAGIDETGSTDNLVSLYEYNSLVDRLTMLNELNNNIITTLNTQGTIVDTKVKVPFSVMKGGASFEETPNGIRYTGTLGKATFVKYFPTGYNTLYIDVNLVLSNFYGILLGFNPVTKKCLWFFEGQNQIMLSNNIDMATNFQLIEGLGSNFPLGSPGSVKVVRSGTTFTFYRKSFQATEDFPADPSVTLDVSKYFDRIDVTSGTIEWAYGVVIGFTSRFAQANTNLGHFEGIYLDNQTTSTPGQGDTA